MHKDIYEAGISEAVIGDMIDCAMKARQYAYTPYSHFQVGAALLAADDAAAEGTERLESACADSKELSQERVIITGCNIENAAYSPGNCAERTAVFKAVSEGYRHFYAIALVVGAEGMSEEALADMEHYTSPCGMCRQVLREFVNPASFYVIMAKSRTDYVVKTLDELLPMSFGPENLR